MIETRLIFDTGTFVLIWLVQLIIYPSFQFQTKEDFQNWHQIYTRRLTYIVAPLLAGQGLSIAHEFFTQMSLFSFIQGCLITGVMFHTFIYFIPLHSKLQTSYTPDLVKKLISKNWIRTVVWSLILINDIVYFFVSY